MAAAAELYFNSLNGDREWGLLIQVVKVEAWFYFIFIFVFGFYVLFWDFIYIYFLEAHLWNSPVCVLWVFFFFLEIQRKQRKWDTYSLLQKQICGVKMSLSSPLMVCSLSKQNQNKIKPCILSELHITILSGIISLQLCNLRKTFKCAFKWCINSLILIRTASWSNVKLPTLKVKRKEKYSKAI